MGDPAAEAKQAIEVMIEAAIDATREAADAADRLDDYELGASVHSAVAAADFSLSEALRRLSR